MKFISILLLFVSFVFFFFLSIALVLVSGHLNIDLQHFFFDSFTRNDSYFTIHFDNLIFHWFLSCLIFTYIFEENFVSLCDHVISSIDSFQMLEQNK